MHVIAGFDPLLIKYVETPPEVSFVRVASDKFEEDQGQEIFTERWKEN